MQNSMNGSQDKSFGFVLDFISLIVVSVSIVSIVLLISDAFSPKNAFFLGAAISMLVFSSLKREIFPISNPQTVGLFAIGFLMLIALVFRVEPYPWINGGQDQGVYVSMSAHYQHGGDIFINDNVLPHFTSEDDKTTYRENRQKYQWNNQFHPGVYYGGEKDYVFQFYHLHPLWMAIFAEVLGDDARVYSLVFFSLLSIVFLSLLAFELSGSRTAAISVGLLLAVNPLHAFFSKWPVTEVVALAFSSMAFYYLARAYRLSEFSVKARWALTISCLCISMLFFVRITGFLYLPGLFLLFLVGAWLYRVKKQKFGFNLILYVLACVSIYVVSIFYGLKFSPNYSVDIYRGIFGKISWLHWSGVLTSALAVMLILMLAFYYWAGNQKFSDVIAPLMSSGILTKLVIILVILTFTIALYRLYLIGYTNIYVTDSWIGKRWRLAGSGLQAVMRSSVLNWFIYTSPVLVAAGFIALWRRTVDVRLSLLFAMMAVALGAVILQITVIPYQYYYARYLLSETVPYGIVVFVAILVGGESRPWRNVGLVAVALSVLLFGFLTFKQFGAQEGVRPLHVLERVNSHIDDGDILLVEPEGWRIPRFGVETPLRFYFGLKTFALNSSDRNAYLDDIANDFRNIWLLSPRRVDEDNFILIERLQHHDKVMERTGHVPLKIVSGFWQQELYLYVMKKSGWPSTGGKFVLKSKSYDVASNSSEVEVLLSNGWYNMEREHVWSKQESKITLKKKSFVDNTLPQSVTLHFWPFAASQKRPVTLHIKACGKSQDFTYLTSERTSVYLPGICDMTSEQFDITLKVDDAISPKALGLSGDARELGIALYQIDLE